MSEAQHETIIVLDYGSQYSQLIARRVREAQVFCRLLSWRTPAEEVLAYDPKGFILSGGPKSVYDPGAPALPDYVLKSGRPILGICYGMQLLTRRLGGQVGRGLRREYGPARLEVGEGASALFDGWQLADPGADGVDLQRVWMSHGDKVESLPASFEPIAQTDRFGRATSCLECIGPIDGDDRGVCIAVGDCAAPYR